MHVGLLTRAHHHSSGPKIWGAVDIAIAEREPYNGSGVEQRVWGLYKPPSRRKFVVSAENVLTAENPREKIGLAGYQPNFCKKIATKIG